MLWNGAIVAGIVLVVWFIIRTRWYWLPGAALVIGGAAYVMTAEPSGGHGGPALLGDGMETFFGAALILIGIVWVLVALWVGSWPRPQPRPRVEIPPASVVKRDDVSKT